MNPIFHHHHPIHRSLDLTEGNITRQLLLFSMPILAGNLFQTLYHNVDALVVGNFVGKEALAAVNTCTPIANLMTGFFTGMSTGASVVYSRFFGAGDYKRLRDSIHTTVLFALLLGFSMALSGILLVKQILFILNCPADSYEYTRVYLTIYIAGLMFTAFYNIAASTLRAVGDSQSPFYALILSSVLNIVLDLVLVIRFEMGVAGVAIATVISQIISVILVFRRMCLMDERYRFRFREMRIDPKLLHETIAFGLPAGIQTALISISNLLVNRYINGFGSEYMAGVGVCQKVDRFISMPCQSVGLAVTTFVSQNIGAGHKDRIRRGVASCFALSFTSIVLMGIPILLHADVLIKLFNRDALVVQTGVDMIHVMMPFYFVMAVNQILSGMMRGFGYSFQVMIASLLGMVCVRQLFLFFAMRAEHTITHIYYAYPIGWAAAAIGVFFYYLYCRHTGRLTRVFEIYQKKERS